MVLSLQWRLRSKSYVYLHEIPTRYNTIGFSFWDFLPLDWELVRAG